MNPERLLQNFDRMIDTPDAVPRLRRFILDLAVRGKLVEQNPEDEPAAELLKRIEAEKRRRFGSDKKTQLLDEVQLPFTIPDNWQWTQLAQIGVINPRNNAEDSTDASFVPMPLIFAEYGRASQHDVRPWSDIKKGFTHFAEGDVGLAKITPCFENGKSTVFRRLTGGLGAGTTELHIVRPIFVLPDYILLYLKTHYFIETGIPKMTGTAGQKRVPKDYFSFSPFPLPPLAEQNRIVAKVDELMKLCDELETAQAKREKRRDRLVASTLHGLNNGDSDSEASERLPFEDSARFYFNHLPRLTTRPEHIQQLRQTILNLAIRGRLVPQDPNDRTVSDLLDTIHKKKEQLMSERGIRREKDVDYSIPFNLPDIPALWIWTYVDDVAIIQGGKRLPKGASFSKLPTPHIYIRVTDMKNGTILADDLQYITPEVQRAISRYTINHDDLYITIAGTIGQVGKVPTFFDGHNLTENAAKIVFRGMNAEYLRLALSSEIVQHQFRDKTKQMAQPKLALKRIAGAKFPLPPLAEQHRIVAKVNELMSLCDEMEARINTNTTTSRKFLEATLQEALCSAV